MGELALVFVLLGILTTRPSGVDTRLRDNTEPRKAML
jgi:hypothetical protein